MTPLADAVQQFVTYLDVRAYAERTVKGYRYSLNDFADWALELGIDDPRDVTRPVLLAYQRHLHRRRSSTGKRLSTAAQGRYVSILKSFFRWLTKNDLIDANPAADLERPKAMRHLPKDVLNPDEVERVFAMADLSTFQGLRDRAIMEVLYATGIRRAELVGLDVRHINTTKERVFVARGKGGKDRVVPISKRALIWVERYLDIRDTIADDDEEALFVSALGSRLSPRQLGESMRSYILRSDIGKAGACHIFRHTLATAMLENGADVRFVQELLGHSELSTTAIYTRVSISKLHEVYRATHPGRVTTSSALVDFNNDR